MKIFTTIGVLALVVPGLASAAAVGYSYNYNQDLVGPGWYNGNGPLNGNFTTNQDSSGIELGLRAKYRAHGLIDGSNGIYTVPAGSQGDIFPTEATNRAAWNYEFSINLKPGGSGLVLQNIVAELVISDLNNPGDSFTLNLLSTFADSSGYGGTVTAGGFNTSTQWGVQNSENPTFADFQHFAVPYNMFSAARYKFDLNVYQSLAADSNNAAATHGALLATDSIIVNVTTPEPASLSLIGFGLIGFGAMIAKRRRNNS